MTKPKGVPIFFPVPEALQKLALALFSLCCAYFACGAEAKAVPLAGVEASSGQKLCDARALFSAALVKDFEGSSDPEKIYAVDAGYLAAPRLTNSTFYFLSTRFLPASGPKDFVIRTGLSPPSRAL